MSSKVKSPVRLAIIGCGGISKNHGGGILANAGKVKCVALCDISEENLKARSEQLGGVAAQFSDWKKMLAEMGSQIDAVIVCLPHHLHAPAILDAVAAGKHILCEKPMCINLEEAGRIVEAVRNSGITYMSGHNQLFMASVQEARRLIEAGEIGPVRWIRSQDSFLAGGGKSDPFKGKWRASLRFQGGGELIDTGYHPTYRLLYLANSPVVGVRASMSRFQQSIEGEDTACVQVRFASGAIGEVFTSWAMPQAHGSHPIHVTGAKGQIFGSYKEISILHLGEKQPQTRALGGGDTFIPQMAHFAECLIEGKRPIHGPEEGREVLEVILKAARDADGWQQHAPLKV